MNVFLMPYTTLDGIPTFGDTFIKNLFNQMIDDDTAKMVFYDGSATNADDFLYLMKFGKNLLWVVNVEKEISGIVWLNNFEPRRASFHFCFFSNVWGKDTVFIGRECVLQLLYLKKDNKYEFDLLTGLVPNRNKKAIKWCYEMNFKVLGSLPCAAWIAEVKRSEPATIFYVQRGKYYG